MSERPRHLSDLQRGIMRFVEAMRTDAAPPVEAGPPFQSPADEERAARLRAGKAVGALLGAAVAEALHAVLSGDGPRPSPPDRSHLSNPPNPHARR
jgi:hypothetical protein